MTAIALDAHDWVNSFHASVEDRALLRSCPRRFTPLPPGTWWGRLRLQIFCGLDRLTPKYMKLSAPIWLWSALKHVSM